MHLAPESLVIKTIFAGNRLEHSMRIKNTTLTAAATVGFMATIGGTIAVGTSLLSLPSAVIIGTLFLISTTLLANIYQRVKIDKEVIDLANNISKDINSSIWVLTKITGTVISFLGLRYTYNNFISQEWKNLVKSKLTSLHI